MQKRDRILVAIMVVAVLVFFAILVGDWPGGGGFGDGENALCAAYDG